jgi:FAD binding domain
MPKLDGIITQQLAASHAYAAGRTVLEVLQDFPSARPPVEWLLQTVPRLRPRLFSISSAQSAAPTQVDITAAIVDWVTPFKRRRKVRLFGITLDGTAFLQCVCCALHRAWHEGTAETAVLSICTHTFWPCAGGVHVVAGSLGPAAGGGAGAGVGGARRIRVACRPSCSAHTRGTRHWRRTLPRILTAQAADRRWDHVCSQGCHVPATGTAFAEGVHVTYAL